MKLNLTKSGTDTLLHCLEGGPSPVFTAIVIGNGADAGLTATALSNQMVSIGITNCEIEMEGFVTLTGSFENTNITDRFHETEIGVLIEDPDNEGQTILFAYAHTEEINATVIPAAGDYVFENVRKVSVYIGSTENVSAVISESLATVSQQEFKAHTNDSTNPHGVTAQQVGLGNVPNVTTENQEPTFELPDSKAELTSGEKWSVMLGKIARAVKDLISHMQNYTNPHDVYPGQIGAAYSSHTHSATNITSGILSVARGGTGVSTKEALATAYGSALHAPVFGHYTGNNGVKRQVYLGFKPSAVLVVSDEGFMGDDIQKTCGGLAYGSYGVKGYQAPAGYDTTWSNDYTAIMIFDHGFYVNYSSSNNVRTNMSGMTYRYVAFR